MYGTANDYRVEMTDVGHRIRTLRESKGISIRQMARFFNLTPQALYRWERGEVVPEIQNLVALSRLFGTSVDALLVGDTYPIVA